MWALSSKDGNNRYRGDRMTALPSGIPLRAELLYLTLLRRTRWVEAELAPALNWSTAEVCAAVAQLRAEGLVTTSSDDNHAIRAVEPRLALPAMAARRLHSRSGEPLPSAAYVERLITLH